MYQAEGVVRKKNTCNIRINLHEIAEKYSKFCMPNPQIRNTAT